MIGKVYRRCFVCYGTILKSECILRKSIFDRVIKLTGIAFLSIGRSCRESDGITIYECIIDLFIKTNLAAVKVVRAVIAIKIVILTVKVKLATAGSNIAAKPSDRLRTVIIACNSFVS